MDTERAATSKAGWRPLLRWVLPHRAAFAAVALGVVSSLLEVVSIALVAPLLAVTDAGIVGNLGPFARVLPMLEGRSPTHQRALLVGMILAAIALRGVAWWGSAVLREKVGVAIHAGSRLAIFRRLARAPRTWLEKRSVGDQDALLLHETERLSTAATGLVQLVVMSAMAACYTALLLYMAPWLTVAAVAFLALVAEAIRLLRRPIERHAQKMRTEARGVASRLHETLAALHLLQQVGHAPDAALRFDESSRRYLEAQRGQRRALDAIPPVAEFCAAVVVLTVLWLGSTVLPIRGQADNVLLYPFVLTLYRLLPRFLAIPAARAQLAANLSAVPAIDAFLADPEADPLPDGGGDPGMGPHRVELRGVRFRYGDDRPFVLDDVDLVLEPGKTTALVGRSGAGKSTVVELVLGLRRPDAGVVLVDGKDLASLDGERWRRGIGVVPQEPRLLAGTVAENLRLVAPDAPPPRLAAALETAHAGFVERLAQGVDTPLGDAGARLSGGERQRICLARALMREPSLLVLDEPTSHLDPDGERAVTAAMARAAKGRTVLLIAHRLSTVRAADRIVLLRHGKVAEMGSHAELVATGGEYARLVRLGLDDLEAASASAGGATSPGA